MAEPTRVRPFDWRDLPLLNRVRREGLCFHSQIAFTRGPQPLQNALLDSLTPGRSECTMVLRAAGDSRPDVIGQVSHPYQAPVARLTFVGPAEAVEGRDAGELLDAMAAAVGRRGAHSLVAEVDEHSPAFESLREAGFAIYARQRVWRWTPSEAPLGEECDADWSQEHGADEPAIQSLYHNLVPGLVQQVEPTPMGPHKGLVYYQIDELLGYLDVDRGSHGIWLHPYLHPAVEDAEILVASFLGLLSQEKQPPIYICVRSYQGWLNAKLSRMGLSICNDQAVMVKRLAARVRRPATAPITAFEGTRPEPTAPYASIRDHDRLQGAGTNS